MALVPPSCGAQETARRMRIWDAHMGVTGLVSVGVTWGSGLVGPIRAWDLRGVRMAMPSASTHPNSPRRLRLKDDSGGCG